jgi:putative CocE/NonD family hydrolase
MAAATTAASTASPDFAPRRHAWMSAVLAPSAAVLLCASLLAAGACRGADFGAPLPPAANEIERTSFYIPMSDGTRLAADVYRPKAAGRYPVILHATAARTRPSDTDNRSGAGGFSNQMINLARYGYAFVVVERRGMGASYGVRRGYHDRTEARDAYDLTKWAANQSWSDGKVGVFGCSNTGDAAMHFLTVDVHPALKAVFAGCFNWDKYSGGRRGGVLANWGTGPQSSVEQDIKIALPVDGDEARTQLTRAAQDHAQNTPLLALWSGMPNRDDVSPLTGTPFWEEGSIATYADAVRESKVPVYIQGGWQDDFRAQPFITLDNLTQPVKLVIGNWGHCQSDDFSMAAEALRWYDHWLKGRDNGIMQEPRVHYETVNAGWRTSEQWPVKASHPVSAFLGKGDLGLQAPAPGKVSFRVDYQPLCARGTGLGATCPQDDKGLTFTSAPLAADMELTGHPVADLWLSSSVEDGPVFAYLEDIAPDGAITMVSEGRLQARHRKLATAPFALPGIPWHSFDKADVELLTPGQAARFEFDLLPISYIFKSGHRYRMTLTGADPREKLRKTYSPVPTWTVWFDRAHPSQLILPLVSPTVRVAPGESS